MPRSLALSSLLTWVALLSSLCRGESQPHLTQGDPPPLGQEVSQRALLLEVVKTGILSSIGMEREPRPRERASEEELRRMHRLYRETLRELRGNFSQAMEESWRSKQIKSTVLLPAIVEPVKVLRNEEEHPESDLHWYRAVFHGNSNIKTELTLARAELKLYRNLLNSSKSAQPHLGQEVQVKVSEMKPLNSTALTHIDTFIQTNALMTGDLTLDIRSAVNRWRGRWGVHSLVVDVGLVMGEEIDPKVIPQMILEVGLMEAKPVGRKRLTRSNKEDHCDDDGRCCRKSVNVSFKDIGWSDWVVAPTGYNMHFCDGSCPQNYKPASMHTQVKSRLHHMTKGATPRPCCVPASYEPMILMHYDSRGKLILTPFNDLIVSKCHCA